MLILAPKDDLCLTFANTLFWRGRPTPSESLQGVEDLLRWLAGSAKMTAAGIEAEVSRLDRHPAEAKVLFAAAIGLREAIYRIFAARVRTGERLGPRLAEQRAR